MLASFSPIGYERLIQALDYKVTYTGAEANVLGSLASFGMKTRFVCRIPDNDIGSAAIRFLRSLGIETDHIVRGGQRLGILYLEKGASQRPSKVIYDRLGSGICEAKAEDFDFDEIFKDAGWFHFTGITPALSDSLVEVIEAACIKAKEYGCIISCDLNYRKNLWTPDKAKSVMESLLKYVDVLIANEEDVEKVLGIKAADSDVEKGDLNHEGYIAVAEQLSERYGFKAVATTLRESISASVNNWSALLYTNGEAYLSRKYQIQIVNRVGGGDSFSAGLIYAMQNDMDPQSAVEFAAAASCLKHTIEYDYNMVTVKEVEALVNGNGNGRVQR
jgi:2-dehydro-3-deoxygluconokinase